MKLNQHLLLSTLFILLLVASCTINSAFSASKPDWIEGISRKYPVEYYLTGTGFGDDRQAAEDSAYSAIARIFQAEIKSRTSELEKYTQTEVKGRTHSSRDIQIDQIISVATDKTLSNILIAEIWEDAYQKRTYALAVMDRRQAMVSVKEKIAALDSDIEVMRQKTNSASDKIEKARIIRSIIRLLLDREVHNTDLRIIDPSGRGIGPQVSLPAIKQNLQDILSDIQIGIQVVGPHNAEIRASVAEGLTREGFTVVEDVDEERFDLLVRCRVDFENADLPQWKFVRWNNTVELVNNINGTVFGSFNRHGREGHLSFKEAEDKALRALQADIVNELGQELLSLIYEGE